MTCTVLHIIQLYIQYMGVYVLFSVGVSQELSNLDVCVNPESSYLLVEWEVKNSWHYLQVYM